MESEALVELLITSRLELVKVLADTNKVLQDRR